MYNIGSGFSFREFSLEQKRTQRCSHIIAGVLRVRSLLDTNGDHALRQHPRNLRRLHWLVLPLFQVARLPGHRSAKHTFTLYCIYLVSCTFTVLDVHCYKSPSLVKNTHEFIVYIKVLSVGFTTLPWYWCRPMFASTHLSMPRSTTNSRRPSKVSSVSRVNRKETLNEKKITAVA